VSEADGAAAARIPRGEWRPSVTLLAGVLTVAVAAYASLGIVAPWRYVLSIDSDFLHYFRAARAVAEGTSPYSVPGFDYPPLLAIVVLPLVPLGPEAARWAWLAAGHACLLGAAALLWRRLGGDRAALVAVALAWGAGGTIAENLALGQVNPLLLLLVVVSLGQGRVGRALALGGATALKLWPGILLVGDWMAGRPRDALRAAAVASGLVLVPLLAIAALLPPPSTPPHAGYWMGTPALYNFSVPATLLRVLDPPRAGAPLPRNWVVGNDPGLLALSGPRRAASVGVGAAGLTGSLILLAWAVRRRGGPALDPILVTGALLGLVLAWAPLCWYHYRLLHFVGAAALCSSALRRRRWPLLAATMLALAVATWPALALDRLYVAAFGWTAAAPAALWGLTVVVPLADLALALLCVRTALEGTGTGAQRPFAAAGWAAS